MLHDPTFWVAVAFIAFVALLVFFKLPGMIAGALDSRAAKIKADLDQAEELLRDAQDLLSSYQKKQRDAAEDAKQIKKSAAEEAKRIAKHGEEKLAQALERREKLAMERIAQAEAQALDDIRRRTVDIALDATRELLAAKLSDDKRNAMVDDAVRELPNRLN
jgi:F-type H+-transporting ATPase subunit b